MRKSHPILACAALAFAGGCVSYEPQPLDGRAELAALSARSLQDLVQVRPATPGPRGNTTTFDLTDGLDEDEAVAVAITLNPDLQAARAAIGESDALLVSAKVLPNPEVGVGLQGGFNGTPGFVLDADVLFELLRPGERSARVGVAEAKGQMARAEVLNREYELAAEVRRQVLAVLAAEHEVALLDDEVALRRHLTDLVRARKGVGEGNELEVSAADLDAAEILREWRLANTNLERARLELNRLMGLPPTARVTLTDSGKPLAITVFEDTSDANLQERVLAGRLDLRVKEAEYQHAEEELRLAVARQYPRLKIGPSFEHDGVSDNYIGIGASLELPIFDRNQGGIAAATASRDRLHAEYTALLHGLSSAAFGARARVRAAKAEIDAEEHEILPLLQHNEEMSKAAFEARELNVIDWVTTQQRALRTRRAYLDSLVAYRRAILDLDAATGMALSNPAVLTDSAGSSSKGDRAPE
jgi:outer membrane protein TolC